jgi:hypothetical protein
VEITEPSDEVKEAELNADHAIPADEPQFGERIEPTVKKPSRGSKKTTD